RHGTVVSWAGARAATFWALRPRTQPKQIAQRQPVVCDVGAGRKQQEAARGLQIGDETTDGTKHRLLQDRRTERQKGEDEPHPERIEQKLTHGSHPAARHDTAPHDCEEDRQRAAKRAGAVGQTVGDVAANAAAPSRGADSSAEALQGGEIQVPSSEHRGTREHQQDADPEPHQGKAAASAAVVAPSASPTTPNSTTKLSVTLILITSARPSRPATLPPPSSDPR